MFLRTVEDNSATSSTSPPCTSLPTSTPGSSSSTHFTRSLQSSSPSPLPPTTSDRGAQVTLRSQRRGLNIPRHDIHRRAPNHDGQQSTTAILAGVIGGFGALCVVGCVIWAIKRRKRRKERERRREARDRRKAEAESKAAVAAQRVGKEVRQGMSGSPGTLVQDQGAVRPSDSSKTLSATLATERMRQPVKFTRNPTTVPSPLRSNSSLPPSPQVPSRATPHSSPQAVREKLPHPNQSPRPRPQEVPRESTDRAETPTMPVHPQLAFSRSPSAGSPAIRVSSNSSTSVPTASRAYRSHPRRHVGGSPGDASDTDYTSDASTAATRQTLTNMGGGGGIANNSRIHQSPRMQVQQTLVLDLPPAYTPDPD